MDIVERFEAPILFSTDPARVDIDAVHAFLRDESYWVPGIRRELLERALANSLCFGAYRDGAQLAFARVVTDQVGFAYLCDVFVLEIERGRGLGQRLMEFVLAHPALQTLRRFALATRDAHAFYARYGFQALAAPERWMERYRPDALS